MIKEAIEKIVSLVTPEVYTIGEDTYTTNNNMRRVKPHIDKPPVIDFSSLDSIVKAIEGELWRDEITKPVFVNVLAHDGVRVFTTYRGDDMSRDTLYTASPNLPHAFNPWNSHDDMIIALRSQFIPGEDVDYLLDLLARISKDDGVSSEDNGVSQKVTATAGVALKANVNLKPRVTLAPFRTFLEVEQPASEFILRLKDVEDDAPMVGIIEADGGAWKLAAKKNIAKYFRAHLSRLIDKNIVIVTE